MAANSDMSEVRKSSPLSSRGWRSAPRDVEKLQIPSSKLQRNSKHQTSITRFGAWDLVLLWSLDVEAWSFL
jgi:hypothetical protein